MKRYIILFIFLLCCIKGISQQLRGPLPEESYGFSPNDILPPPVNAATINKGGSVDINMSVGTPNVAIPLTEVKSRFLGFPVSLNYTSNGVRVNEIASFVGLGWSLNCGGVLYRTTLGLPDEEREQYNTDFDNFTKPRIGNFDRATVNYFNGKRDRESDIFEFSVNGFVNGKFILDSLGNPLLLDAKSYRVSKLSNNIHDGFEVVDDKGIKYLFNVADTSFFDRVGSNCASDRQERNKEIINSWNLASIIMPAKDTIRFKYIRNNCSYIADLSESESICVNSSSGSCPGGSIGNACTIYSSDYSLCFTTQKVYGKLLSEVEFVNGRVLFEYSSSRKDISGGAVLEKIEVLNNKNIIKKVSLNHDYFKSSAFDLFLRRNALNDSALLYRLILSGVTVNSGDDSEEMMYELSYLDGNKLPARLSASQDIYGFNNGKANSYLLNNAEDDYPMDYYNKGYPMRYGDRSFDAEKMGYGLLNKIVYPTGGYDSIIYDHNKKLESYKKDYIQSFNIGVVGKEVADSLNVRRTTLNMAIGQEVDLFVNVDNITDPPIEDWRLHQYGHLKFHNILTGETLIDYTVNLRNPRIQKKVFFPAGSYEVSVSVDGGAVLQLNAFFSYMYKPSDTLQRLVPMGGLRVAQIASLDPVSKGVVNRYFKYGGTFSILQNATFGAVNVVPKFMNCEGFYDCAGSASCVFYFHSHNVVQPSSLLGGNIIYHDTVTEYTIDRDSIERAVEHKFAYHFIVAPRVDYGGVIANTPYGVYNDFLIGETETTSFAYNRLTKETRLFKKTINTFSIGRKQIATNFAVDKTYESPCMAEPPSPVEYNAFKINSYPIYKVENKLYSNKTILYSSEDVTQSMEDITTYEYTSYAPLLPSKISVTSSNGKSMIQTYKYCFDYSGNSVLSQLKSNNMLLPVEVANYVNNVKAKQDRIEYKLANNNIATPAAFRFFQQNGNNQEYKVSEITGFNRYANPVSALKNDVPECYIWDYDNSYVIAAVSNASLTDIAYTSFESDSPGGWNINGGSITNDASITGFKAWNLLSGTISSSTLDVGKVYTVSYWTRNASPFVISGTKSGYPVKGKTAHGWTYYEHAVTGRSTISITGTGYLDELRLYPFHASMITYSYEPQIGIVSECSSNNNITYYEYDGLGRLQIVRDHNDNILRIYKYEYRVGDTTAIFYSDALSGTFTKTCSVGMFSTPVTYSLPHGAFTSTVSLQDANSQAAAYFNIKGQELANAQQCLYRNSQLSRTLQKNDCSPFQGTGTMVTYVVPVGKHTSPISQADADSLAQEDLTQNAQTYANMNGICECIGEGRKSINGICQRGVRVNDATLLMPDGRYRCTYHYSFSDGSTSGSYTDYGPSPCPVL